MGKSNNFLFIKKKPNKLSEQELSDFIDNMKTDDRSAVSNSVNIFQR